MKVLRLVAVFIGLAAPLVAEPEVAVLVELIESTQAHLAEQKVLLSLMMDFKKKRDTFVRHPTSGRLATQLVEASSLLASEIDQQRLSYLFSSDFLTEIRFFAQVLEEKR